MGELANDKGREKNGARKKQPVDKAGLKPVEAIALIQRRGNGAEAQAGVN
jgi:hypothetical protein